MNQGTTESAPTSAAQANDAHLDDRLRKLVLDNEDLRFECARLGTSLESAQQQILDLQERSATLQHKLDRIYRLAPRGSGQVLRWIATRFRRR